MASGWATWEARHFVGGGMHGRIKTEPGQFRPCMLSSVDWKWLQQVSRSPVCQGSVSSTPEILNFKCLNPACKILHFVQDLVIIGYLSYYHVCTCKLFWLYKAYVCFNEIGMHKYLHVSRTL